MNFPSRTLWIKEGNVSKNSEVCSFEGGFENYITQNNILKGQNMNIA